MLDRMWVEHNAVKTQSTGETYFSDSGKFDFQAEKGRSWAGAFCKFRNPMRVQV